MNTRNPTKSSSRKQKPLKKPHLTFLLALLVALLLTVAILTTRDSGNPVQTTTSTTTSVAPSTTSLPRCNPEIISANQPCIPNSEPIIGN